MEELYDALLFGDDLSPEERSSIQDRFEEDSEWATAWAHWCAVRHRMRDRLQEHISDRRLLVLYVLAQAGDTDALTARERQIIDEAQDEIEQAIEALPALEQIVERIRAERADFEEVWDEHLGGEELMAEPAAEHVAPTKPDERTDRAARSPRSRRDAPARRWSRRLAVAAVIVGLAAVAVLFWPQGSATNTVTVADGGVQVQTLGDGSTVRLVGPATLTYPSEEAPPRRVTLAEGRAFFDVQHREDASFVVETPTASATVLGTQFGVTTRADTTEVVLANGSVRVSDAEGLRTVVLEPGQHSRVAKSEAPTTPKPVDLTGTLDWTGLFVFRTMSLDTIVDRLNRHYDAQITVAESLAGEAVTGTFEREQPVEEVLGALAATLGAKVQDAGDDQYRLVPAP